MTGPYEPVYSKGSYRPKWRANLIDALPWRAGFNKGRKSAAAKT
jgi:hypothetical protein